MPTTDSDRDAASRPRDPARAEAAVRELILALGEDPDRTGMTRTPQRFVAAMADRFAGVGIDPATAIPHLIELDPGDDAAMVKIVGIVFRSLCEHHLLTFAGTIDVAFAPRAHTAGFSRIVDLVTLASQRPQLQEHLGATICHALAERLSPRSVVVRIEADHGCMSLHDVGSTSHVVTETRWSREEDGGGRG